MTNPSARSYNEDDYPPCFGKGNLFWPTNHELVHPDESFPHTEAVLLCAQCPKVTRKACAAQGVRFKDRSTVRCGLRLWINEERAQLLAISEGAHTK